jgi:hypothetical protein
MDWLTDEKMQRIRTVKSIIYSSLYLLINESKPAGNMHHIKEREKTWKTFISIIGGQGAVAESTIEKIPN